MKKIYDETYTDNEKSSRNIWYSEVPLHKESEFGPITNLEPLAQQFIVDRIQLDLNDSEKVTETNWYFYDSITTQDANEDQVRTSLMIKLQNEEFIVHLNISDHTFALNFNNIRKQIKSLEAKLNG